MDDNLDIRYVYDENSVEATACHIDGHTFVRVNTTVMFENERVVGTAIGKMYILTRFDSFEDDMSFTFFFKTAETDPKYLQFLLASADVLAASEFNNLFVEFGAEPVINVSSPTQRLDRYYRAMSQRIRECVTDLVDTSDRNVKLKKKKAMKAYNAYHEVTRW